MLGLQTYYLGTYFAEVTRKGARQSIKITVSVNHITLSKYAFVQT